MTTTRHIQANDTVQLNLRNGCQVSGMVDGFIHGLSIRSTPSNTVVVGNDRVDLNNVESWHDLNAPEPLTPLAVATDPTPPGSIVSIEQQVER